MPKVIKIYGPPGTGKTTTLISTLKSVLASGTPLTRVAYITHTKAACEEVKQRVIKDLEGVVKKDMKWFRTIHSMCCGMCRIGFNDIWTGKDADTFNEETGLYIRGSFDIEALEEYNEAQDEGYDIVLFADQLAKARMEPLSDVIRELPPSSKLVDPRVFLDQYEAFKKTAGKKDFTDMLLEYHGGGYPPGDVDVVIVDEAQDLSKLQWEIVNMFAADADELHLAGDDDQSIYKFLGADEFGFLDHPADETNVLTFSYRVPQSIGEAATSIIKGVKRRKEKEVQWQDEPGEIKRYALDDHFLPWKEWAKGDEKVMVLTRHRRQMYDVRQMLNEMQIPHTVKGKSMANSKMGLMIRIYLELREGLRDFRPAVVAQMLKATGHYSQAKIIADRGVADRKLLLTRDDLPFVNWDRANWATLFTDKKWELRQIEVLRRQLNEYGLDVISSTPPNIDVSTYHGSKGREAHHVILYTDCYQATWDEQERNPDSETRLAYVGLTRAMKSVTIIVPQTLMYLRALG